MKPNEVQVLTERIAKYNAHADRVAVIGRILDYMRTPLEDAPCGQTPFTGNIRESRDVHSLAIQFSPTRGGASAVGMHLERLQIPAYEFGRFIEAQLEKQRTKLAGEMDAI